MLPITVTLHEGIFQMTSFTEEERLFYKKNQKNFGGVEAQGNFCIL